MGPFFWQTSVRSGHGEVRGVFSAEAAEVLLFVTRVVSGGADTAAEPRSPSHRRRDVAAAIANAGVDRGHPVERRVPIGRDPNGPTACQTSTPQRADLLGRDESSDHSLDKIPRQRRFARRGLRVLTHVAEGPPRTCGRTRLRPQTQPPGPPVRRSPPRSGHRWSPSGLQNRCSPRRRSDRPSMGRPRPSNRGGLPGAGNNARPPSHEPSYRVVVLRQRLIHDGKTKSKKKFKNSPFAAERRAQLEATQVHEQSRIFLRMPEGPESPFFPRRTAVKRAQHCPVHSPCRAVATRMRANRK